MKYMIPVLLMSLSFANAEIVKSGAKAPTSKKEFCEKGKNPDYFKSLFYNNENQIAFRNQGGLMDGGVCWWHSMLTRNVQYLAVFKPELPKATPAQASAIIAALTDAKLVVEIPGYNNFSEFSSDYHTLVQEALDGWQISDGAVGFGWVRGITGDSKVDPAEMAKSMDDTYKVVKGDKRVAYQKIQIEGIESHAWLVVDMIKKADGYTLEVVDSNYAGIKTINYTHGMTHMDEYSSVPYTSRNGIDYYNYSYAFKQYCSRGITAL